MAKNPFQPWFKRRMAGVLRRPIEVNPYTDYVYWVKDNTNPDVNFNEAMLGADEEPGSLARMMAALDPVLGAGVSGAREEEQHGSPMMFLTRNRILHWGGRGQKAGKTRTVRCRKCLEFAKVAQVHPIQVDATEDNPEGLDYEHNQGAWGGCVESDPGNPFRRQRPLTRGDG